MRCFEWSDTDFVYWLILILFYEILILFYAERRDYVKDDLQLEFRDNLQ